MDFQLNLTLAILAAALILFIWDVIPADLVALLVAVALGVTGVLTPQEAFSGFSRAAVITIMAIFILASALQRTGVTEHLATILLRFGGRSEARLVVAVMAAGAFLSLFMNNIAAAAVLLPGVSGAAKKASVHISRLLMPLAISTSLGGMATLLTTSNIVMNSILHDNNLQGFGLMDFAPVGIPIMLAGITYVGLIGRRFLPGESIIEKTLAPSSEQHKDLISAYNLGANLFRARVPDKSFLIGKKLQDSTLREKFDVSVVGIERDNRKIFGLTGDTRIEDGDILVLEGDEADFRRRDVEPYMEYLPAPKWRESDLETRAIEVVEAMIAPRSRLIGETLRSTNFRDRYGVSVLAIWRGTKEIVTDIADVQLAFGDALLLQGPREKLEAISGDPDLIVLMEVEETKRVFRGRRKAAVLIFLVTLLVAAMLPELTGAVMLGGAILMIAARILTTDQAYASISWKTVFLVAGMLPMGIALTKTNAAAMMADLMLGIMGGYGHLALLAGLLLTTMLLTLFINGAAVAAIVGPMAIQMAQGTNANPRSLAMGVAIATSMAFVTPLGHPVNVLVMSPGGYKFSDFIKVGLPLSILLFFVVLVFLPIFWPL